jgi:uncharacterized membrane protein YoaK (UPF0700 family)
MNVWRFVLGLFLTAAAGAIDAVSFVRLGAVYASFMSGNTVQIGIHTGGGDFAALGVFGVLVGLFMLGGFVGSLILNTTGSWHLALLLLLESAALAGAVWLDLHHGNALATTAPLSFAMGAQNNLVTLIRGANPATTFVTGTAFRFADAVAQRVLGRDPWGAWKLHLLVWASFAAGAALGTLSQARLADLALAPIAATMIGLAVLALTVRLARGGPAAKAA